MNWFDPSNPVIALCAQGMQVDGVPEQARALFEEAWRIRRDDFDASVAAHFLARHQPTPADTLHWNAVALQHADALTDARAATLVPSLCLNLGDSYLSVGRIADAERVATRGMSSLAALPDDGYAAFVRAGLERLHARIVSARESTASDAAASP